MLLYIKFFHGKILLYGEVSERLKVQTWKVCVGATSPGVRIPPSPNFASTNVEASYG